MLVSCYTKGVVDDAPKRYKKMITAWKAAKSGNVWEPGQTVRVGFLTLRVLSARAEKDYLPDIYTLESLDGTKRYEFIPHNGLHRLGA